ncbi:MAG: FG-GAP-like repeat-containing protein [Bacteroidales bacterium]
MYSCSSWPVRLGSSFAQFTYTMVTNGLNDIFEGGSMQFNIGDIDNDGDLDIVSVGDHSSPLIPAEHGVMVFKNNGDGTAWTKVMNGDFGYGGVALGDVNNDGHMDVAYGVHHNYSSTDFGDQVLEVALGDGTGVNWIPYDDNLGQQGQSWGMSGCDFGDIDNDGLLDLGANAFGCCDGVWLYKNNGNGSWSNIGGALDLNSTGQFRFGDFNRDGKIDFVANNTQYNNQLYQIWQNTGNNQFISMQTSIPFSDDYFNFDIADVNNDGAPDIGLIYYGVPYVYTYNVFSNTWESISNGLPTTNQNLWNIALGDMDGDGLIDLVTEKSNLITIYKGDGTGNWQQAATLSISETICRDIKIADLDHNGLGDIIYWAEQNSIARLRVYLNSSPTSEMWIRPVTPLGGEFYCHGSVQFIRWTSRVPAGNTSSVDLELSTTGISGPFSTIASNLPNNGKYQWIVPGLSSNDCYIRYTLHTGLNSYVQTNILPFIIDTCGEAYIIPGPLTGNTEICAGSTETYMVPLVVNNTGYSWTLPSGWTGSSNTNTITVTAGQQGGVISVVAHFANGNSAPVTLFVAIAQIDTSVLQSGLTLTAVESSASYQWIDCNTGLTLSGDTNQTYTPLQDGNYAVIITLGNCSDTSSCHPVVVTGIGQNDYEKLLTLFPNPARNRLMVTCARVMDLLGIYTMVGKELMHMKTDTRQIQLDLTDLPPGLYIVRVKSGKETIYKQLIIMQL